MSEAAKDIVLEMNKLHMELKMKLEMVSKWRVECAELQLEYLKLYTPECLEILELFKEMAGTGENSNGGPSDGNL